MITDTDSITCRFNVSSTKLKAYVYVNFGTYLENRSTIMININSYISYYAILKHKMKPH